ncbi:MAG: tetratricopeptide repeat protein, partial [Saprospiraceae bacterium]|nr:tetratricopeptide repeat protein [Saprospiraceae bacterium]
SESLTDDALEVINLAVEQYPYSAEFLLRRIHINLYTRSLDGALETLDKADAILPNCVDVHMHRAMVYAELGWLDQALELLGKCKMESIDKQELSLIHLYEGLIYEKQTDLEQMFTSLKESLEYDPKNQTTLVKMNWCINHTGKSRESVRVHKQVIDHHPYSAWGWFNLANAYEDLCEYELAIEAYEFALVIDEDFTEAYRNCSEVCLNTRNYKRALRHLEDLMKRQEDEDPDTMMKIGLCLLKEGKLEMAREYLLMAEAEETFNDEIHFLLGECYRAEGKLSKAINHYKKAISLFPAREEYFIGLGKVYERQQKPEAAKKYYKRAVDLGPDLPRNWIAYSKFLHKQGETEKALEILEKSKEYLDDLSTIKYYHVAFLLDAGKNAEALYYLGEALKEDFAQHTLLFDLVPAAKECKKCLATIQNFEKNYTPIV